MKFNQLNNIRKNKFIKIITNKYVVILLVFIIWMLFFDENSYLMHRNLDKQLDKLKTSVQYFKKEIKHDKKELKDLSNPDSLEKFAREKYYFKKKNEDLYIIEYDSVNK